MAGFICTSLEEQEINVPNTSPQCLSVAVVSFKAGVVISSLHLKKITIPTTS